MRIEMIPISGDNLLRVEPLEEMRHLHKNVKDQGIAVEAITVPKQFAVIRPIPMDDRGNLELK